MTKLENFEPSQTMHHEPEIDANDFSNADQLIRQLLDTVPVGVAIVSKTVPLNGETGPRLYVNPAFVQLFGTENANKARVASIEDSWADPIRHREFEKKMATQDEVTDFEAERIGCDGRRLWLTLNSHHIFFQNQSCKIVWHFDNTQRKRAEEQKIAMEARYRTFVDASPAHIVEKDLNGLYLNANKSWHDAMNEFGQDLSGKTAYEFYPRKLADKLTRMDQYVISSGYPMTVETDIRLPHGEVRTYFIQKFPIFDSEGQLSSIGTINQDNTARKRLEDEHQQLILAVESIAECIVLFDQSDRIIFCNAAYKKLNEEIVDFTMPGTKFEDHLRAGVRAGIMPDATGREEEWIAERLYHHRNPSGPIEVRRQDGMTILVNEQLLSSGYTILIILDISELKRSQKEVIQASKLATLGEMSTAVSHELNQPLNVIRMASGNCRMRIERGTADNEYISEKLARIEEQTARAALIIDHMRMFGRKADEDPVLVNPCVAVQNALDLVGSQFRLANIKIIKNFPPRCAYVLGHSIQIEQVILNLLTNARDALESRRDNCEITVHITEEGEYVAISVEDNGRGFEEHALSQIFEPFFTTKEMGNGTGLGLSISYGIVSDMKGTMEARNTSKGALVELRIPAAKM